MTINDLLSVTVKKQASDLHIVEGSPPVVRVDGDLLPLPQYPILSATDCKALIDSLTSPSAKKVFEELNETDFSYTFKHDASLERFRVNVYMQKNSQAASLRHIPGIIKTFKELSLPQTLENFVNLQQGFVMVTGPTGHGKSTTLASILNKINKNRACHMVTIEDPIEYIFPKAKALVSQRELKVDTFSWQGALRSVLREDPDVVLVGEMRDQETIASALTIAETGHLVFSTLHTNSAAQTIDRIIDVFPEHQQDQIRQQLAASLSAVVCQRLVPALSGGRVPALEILISNAAVRTSIRESKTHMIDNIIQTSRDSGMIKLEEYFAQLVSSGTVSQDVAERYSLSPTELRRMLKK